MAVRFKQVDRSEGGAAAAGGVLLPFTPGLSAALAVAFKLNNRIKSGAAAAGGVPRSSTYCPFLILAQYLYFHCRAVVIQIIRDC
ncbi:hypothetical protein [Sansalvadorimonas verongulae]|uniref:hypothetical protein n=1 Tax=Sansalvadorimonas verongulae TaxID=2172824 RepID=UPI0012BB6091|nr:hypothetical protein [Sansalvadorimonas verongulae]MTI11962.1 hypothetical protein [Sansalvadorimonas verongulae]